MTQAPDRPKATHLPLVDGIRGYLIFAMTVGHFIAITGFGALNFLTHKPFAVFLTGEGFMAVSGFMTGYVLTLGRARMGLRGSVIWGLRRSLKIVLHYIAVFALCALPALVWTLEGSFASLLFHGRTGFALSDLALLLTGLYRPGFFDILYLYVVYIALAPLFLALFLSRLWVVPLALCLLLWVLTQYGFTERGLAALIGRIPGAQISEAGSFHIFAWQLLFFGGLSLGACFATAPERVVAALRGLAPARPLLWALAGVFALVGLASATGVVPLGLRYLEDYLIVAPLPLINFLGVCLLIALLLQDAQPGALARGIRVVFGMRWLRDIGKVTLQSFSASIVLSYWVAYAQPAGVPGDWRFALGSFAACLLGVWLTARFTLALRARRKAARTTRPK